jgi:hypothetical protein
MISNDVVALIFLNRLNEIRIYHQALTVDQVQKLYELEKLGTSSL